MFDTICTIPLPSDLFAQALHPTLPLLTVGLSSGHVHTYRLPSENDLFPLTSNAIHDSPPSSSSPPPSRFPGLLTNGDAHTSFPQPIISHLRRSSSISESGLGSIETLWKTRRHKRSCRALAYNHDGSLCYSAGTDGLVKIFETETGRVCGKIAVPNTSNGQDSEDESPSVVHALSPQALLVGVDTGELYCYDLRAGGREINAKPSQIWRPHEPEPINALVPLPVTEASTSGFPKQWVSVGGTTLAVTDIRKGVIATSEDQEEELISVVVLQGLKKGGTSVGEKVLVGQGDGVMSLWEKGVWGDLDERIVVDKEVSIESLTEVPAGFCRKGGRLKMNEKIVAAGMEDGRVRFLRIGRNGVLSEWDIKHDELDGVLGLGFDVENRLVTGGGQIVKVWTEAKGGPGGGRNGSISKHELDSDDESSEDQYSDDSSDEEVKDKSKRKKRKRNKGKDKRGGKAMNLSGMF